MEVHGNNIQTDGSGALQLDTVRALHQTVVSLRDALELSKSELYDLRKKYESHLDVSVYSETIKKLTLENHILRRKLITNECADADEHTVDDEQKTDFIDDPIKKVTFCLEEDPSLEVHEDIEGIQNDAIENTEVGAELVAPAQEVPKQNESAQSELICDESETNKLGDSSKSEGTPIATIVPSSDEPPRDQQSDQVNIETNIIAPKSKSDKKKRNKKHSKKELKDDILCEYETTIELESQFDFTIKVSAAKAGALQPIEVNTCDSSLINISDSNLKRGSREKSEGNIFVVNIPSEEIQVPAETIVKEISVSPDNMAGSREGDSISRSNDKFSVQVKISSEENLIIDPSSEREGQSEHLNVDQDEISVRSISEGDNSVFSEVVGAGTGTGSGGRRVCEQDSISGNESEEVDDIELIFTTDETKELTGFQEDLVSITEGENWATQNETSTPVLLRFNILDPESQLHHTRIPENNTETDNFENENQENSNLQEVLADVDRTHPRKSALRNPNQERNHIASQEGKHDNSNWNNKGYVRSSNSKHYLDTSKQQNRKSFESTESISFDNHKSYSFDNTKSSSFDRGSSVDVGTRELSFDQREESLDQFDVLRTTLRTQYSVYVETDISKCGVMEDDAFSGNLNTRRNTCPNPFQYRPLSHREAVRGAVRPLLAPPPRGPRRSSAAQTDISALPNHWRSDTHLARKVLPLALTTLPSKVCGTSGARLLPPMPSRPTRRSEEARRVLLSDIGFTSMVPELSRSAEPVWGALGAAGLVLPPAPPPPLCCAAHAVPSFGSVPSSPTRHDPSGNSKYWSRGSMQRSISGRMADTVLPGSQRVSFIDQPLRGGWRGSMPELRGASCCIAATQGARAGRGSHILASGDSAGSTEELLDEAERFLRSSIDCLNSGRGQDDFCPSRYSRPYLPTGPRQLRLGHLVKVIAPHGRIALGKVRYVGVAGGPAASGLTSPLYIGVQLGAVAPGGGDGSFRGRRYFHCEPGRSIFVPFAKVVMAWADC